MEQEIEVLKVILDKVATDEKVVEKYMDTFDSLYDKILDKSNFKVIENLFHNFMDSRKTGTNTHLLIAHELAETERRLKDSFTTEEQHNMFKIYDFVQIMDLENCSKKAFIEGFCLGNSIHEEMDKYKKGELNCSDVYTFTRIINKFADKYIDRLNFILAKDMLTLEYFVLTDSEKDLYKTVQIEMLDSNLQVTVLPEKIVKVIDTFKELEDIILIIDKQSQVYKHTPAEIDAIKQKYLVGTKIKLVKMFDLLSPPGGEMGTVTSVDAEGQIHVSWENGSCLPVVEGLDKFIICDTVAEDKEVLVEDAKKILKQSIINISDYDAFIEKYKSYLATKLDVNSRRYELLSNAIMKPVNNKVYDNNDFAGIVNDKVMRINVEVAIEVLEGI